MKGMIRTNKNIVNTFIFIAGAAVGSVVTWQFVKKKYEQIAQEEIDSVKETYAKLHDKTNDTDVEETVTDETPVYDEEDYEEYDALTTVYGGENVPNMGHDKPYVIPPEEFGENEDYDQFSLTLYADNILTDENDCIVEDVESIVGVESLTHFGEYEDDSVFVRNDRLKVDYEILLDTREYSDVLNLKPYLAEDE
jgi:hypothetical protein